MAIGGLGVVLAIVYDGVSPNESSESVPDARVVRLVLLGAVLVVAGTLLQVV